MAASNPRAPNLPERSAAVAKAAALGEVEVLVVGGGINGVGVFRDLALQGVKALIVDRVDFGAGASMANSRMAHGGLRYLENGEFRLTAEATRERNRLLKNAPHMVRPLPMAIPFFSYFAGLFTAAGRAMGLKAPLRERGFVMAEIGLLLYDWFGRFHRGMPLHSALFRKRARALFPELHPAMRAVSIYYDAVIASPERIALELVSDGLAASPGSVALNHCAVVGIDGEAVVLADQIGGDRFAVKPKLVVNAAGAWIDRVNGAIGGGRELIGGAKGSHLVIDQPALLGALSGHGMIFDDGRGRVCIAYPLGEKTLLGSTDIPVSDPDQAHCTEEEQDYLLAAARVIFPMVPLGREHVVYRFCGVRPLPRSGAATPGAVSRDHSLVTFEATGQRRFPVLSLVGGKWTTFRAFAEEVSIAVMARLGRPRTIGTQELPIGGGRGVPLDVSGQQAHISELAQRFSLTESRVSALIGRYGSGAAEVAAFLAEAPDPALPGASDYSEREIRRLVRHEMAVTVDDVIFRRTTLAMEGRLLEPLLTRIAALIAEEAGQSAPSRDAALADLVGRLRIHHGALNPSGPAIAPVPNYASRSVPA